MEKSCRVSRWITAFGLIIACGGDLFGGSSRIEEFTRASCFDVVEYEGSLHLLYGLPGVEEKDPLQFFYTRSENAGESWSISVEIPTGHAMPGRHHRGNDPQLAVSGEHLLAVWTGRGGGPFGSGPLAAAISSDGGRSWEATAAPTNAGPGKDVGFRFPDIVATGKAFHAAWIHAEGEERSLRHARLPFGAKHWTIPNVVDPDICACCWNTLKTDGDGRLYLLYRDQEPSDMALAFSRDEGETWQWRGLVGQFDWFFDGCPHVGGGLVIGPSEPDGEPLLLASVWTGNGETSGGYLFRSDSGGAKWGNRRALEVHSPGRNTDIVYVGSEQAVAVWDEAAGMGVRLVFAATTDDGGKSWGKAFRLSPADRFATHPRVIAAKGRVLALWTAEDGDKNQSLVIRQVENKR